MKKEESTTQKKSKEKLKNRVTELDLIRGICVILMVIDHAIYDFIGVLPFVFADFPREGFSQKIYEFAGAYWNWNVRFVVRIVVLSCFLLLTGICCSFSRNNLKRGLKLGGVALLVTVFTLVAGEVTGDSELLITFGILHCISLALLLCSLIEKFSPPKFVYAIIGGLMIIIGIVLLDFKQYRYSDAPNVFVAILRQIIGKGMYGSDSYSFLVFGGQVVSGVFVGKVLYPERKPILFKNGYKDNPITFAGRHSLLVYVAHQVVLPVIFSLVLLICGFSLAL